MTYKRFARFDRRVGFFRRRFVDQAALFAFLLPLSEALKQDSGILDAILGDDFLNPIPVRPIIGLVFHGHVGLATKEPKG